MSDGNEEYVNLKTEEDNPIKLDDENILKDAKDIEISL